MLFECGAKVTQGREGSAFSFGFPGSGKKTKESPEAVCQAGKPEGGKKKKKR